MPGFHILFLHLCTKVSYYTPNIIYQQSNIFLEPTLLTIGHWIHFLSFSFGDATSACMEYNVLSKCTDHSLFTFHSVYYSILTIGLGEEEHFLIGLFVLNRDHIEINKYLNC